MSEEDEWEKILRESRRDGFEATIGEADFQRSGGETVYDLSVTISGSTWTTLGLYMDEIKAVRNLLDGFLNKQGPTEIEP